MVGIQLITRDVGAGIVVGLITAIGLIIYEYIRAQKQRREQKAIDEKRRALEIEENEIKEKKSNIMFLWTKGLLTTSEYELKIQQINNIEFDKEVKLTQEYLQLKNLLDLKLLTQNEFEEKVEKFKSQFIKSRTLHQKEANPDNPIEVKKEKKRNPDPYKRYFNNDLSRFEIKAALTILFILFIFLPLLGVIIQIFRNISNYW